jgi:hypothetical protein
MVRGQAHDLNPEAGRHEVTMDARELEAVNRASDRSWNEFPYWDARFGERGRRFSLSDGAWIVTLCSGTAAHAIEKVRWLGALLSSRGMPQILLERHLVILHEELGSQRYAHLLKGSRELARLRRSKIRQSVFDRLSRAFEEATTGVAPFPGMGMLLVSAVCDEALGIEHAVTNIVNWVEERGDDRRRWISEVRSTVEKARAALP